MHASVTSSASPQTYGVDAAMLSTNAAATNVINSNNYNNQNQQQQQSLLLRSSVDELRLVGVMLRSFAKSTVASDLVATTMAINNNNEEKDTTTTVLCSKCKCKVSSFSSSEKNDDTSHQDNAALANILEHRYNNNNNDKNNNKGDSTHGEESGISSSSVAGHNDSDVLNQTKIGGNKNFNNNNHNQAASSDTFDATTGTGHVAKLAQSLNNNDNEPNNQARNNYNMQTKPSSSTSRPTSLLGFKSFFPTSEEVAEENNKNKQASSSENPQLISLAERVESILNNLKQLSLTTSTAVTGNNNNNNGTNSSTFGAGDASIIMSSSQQRQQQQQDVSQQQQLLSISVSSTTQNNNQNQNQQQQQDHRKLFPRSAPGWTRRVEPSVIDKYAKEQLAKQQLSMIPAPPSSGRNNNKTNSAARVPIIGSSTATTIASSNKINNNSSQQQQQSTIPSLSAPLHHAQNLLSNAPTTDLRNAMELQELTQATSSSIYMALRTAAVQLRAESAAVFVYFGGEMICCACVGAGSVFPPCSMRFASGGSLAHAVLTSGTALHRTVKQEVNTRKRKNSETVDIRGRRRSLTNNNSSSSITASINQNKSSSSASDKASSYPVQDTLMMPIAGPFGGIPSLNENEQTNTRKEKHSPLQSENNNNNNITSGRRKSSVVQFNNNLLNDESQAEGQQKKNANAKSTAPNSQCRAVLQLQNKNRGTAAFTEVDETKASFFAEVIGYLMHLGDTANLDFRTTSYDPVGVQRSVPFVPAAPLPSLRHADEDLPSFLGAGGSSSEETGNFFLSSSAGAFAFGKQQGTNNNSNKNDDDASSNTNNNNKKNFVTRYFEDFEPRKYIHRSVVDANRQGAEAGSGVARRALLGQAANEVGPAPSLREIDGYVSNLRDCWRRAVDETVTANSESTTRAQQIRDLKTELEKSRGEATKLSELLELERFSAGDYLSHYDELRHELENFLEKRTAGSEELFSWTSQNLVGNKNSNKKAAVES